MKFLFTVFVLDVVTRLPSWVFVCLLLENIRIESCTNSGTNVSHRNIASKDGFRDFMFKEQSPSPRVLLFQTMPEGFSPRAVSLNQQNTRARLIVPIITQHM